MLNIQLFAGPGTGKSTTQAGLFHKFKELDHKTEMIHEYAKDLTYENADNKLKNQFYVTAKQHHRLKRIEDGGEVDYVIHDSPFIMGLAYLNKNDSAFPNKAFENFVKELYSNYNNLNIFIERNDSHKYQEYGRSQSYEEACQKDSEILNLLDDLSIPYIKMPMGPNLIDAIYDLAINHTITN